MKGSLLRERNPTFSNTPLNGKALALNNDDVSLYTLQEGENMATKWEYCELFQSESAGTRLGFTSGTLRYRVYGVEKYVKDEKKGGANDEELLARMVAWLGQQGWELVSVATVLVPGFAFSGVKWIFKRPVE